MYAVIKLYSDKIGEISSFLTHFYKNKTAIENEFLWQKEYEIKSKNGTKQKQDTRVI